MRYVNAVALFLRYNALSGPGAQIIIITYNIGNEQIMLLKNLKIVSFYIFLARYINTICYVRIAAVVFYFSLTRQVRPRSQRQRKTAACAFIDRTFLQLNLSVRLFWIDQIASAEKKIYIHTRTRARILHYIHTYIYAVHDACAFQTSYKIITVTETNIIRLAAPDLYKRALIYIIYYHLVFTFEEETETAEREREREREIVSESSSLTIIEK